MSLVQFQHMSMKDKIFHKIMWLLIRLNLCDKIYIYSPPHNFIGYVTKRKDFEAYIIKSDNIQKHQDFT